MEFVFMDQSTSNRELDTDFMISYHHAMSCCIFILSFHLLHTPLSHCWVSLLTALSLSPSDLFCAFIVLHTTSSDSFALQHPTLVRSFRWCSHVNDHSCNFHVLLTMNSTLHQLCCILLLLFPFQFWAVASLLKQLEQSRFRRSCSSSETYWCPNYNVLLRIELRYSEEQRIEGKWSRWALCI